MTLQETNKLLYSRIEDLSKEIQGLEKRRSALKCVLERSLDRTEASWKKKEVFEYETERETYRRKFRKAKRRYETEKPL